MNKNFLELKGIKKTYPNGFQAIFNLDLEINKGEFVVFVGPSGCGKTTTIRMIAGLENVSNGDIILDGRNATDLPVRKRNISMVFQNYALFPHLSVKENIAFTLKTRRYPREEIEKKVKWAAEALKLEYLLNRKPAQLSGGQRQRVALGRAIVANPKLFLMDEPLSNLDAKLRSVMRTTIRKLHEDLKTTTIYVTHDQVEAMTMADKIVVMSDGFIQQVGKPEEVFQEPANRFVAEFIGTPMINIIDGEYKQGIFYSKLGNLKVSKKLLRKSASGKYQLGFRPQYATLVKKSDKERIECNVSMIEILGSETIIHTKEKIMIVISTDEKPDKGSTIFVKPIPNKVILFDKKNGMSLTNKINKNTSKSLKIFYKSEKLIEHRSLLMAKQKNKKVGEGIIEKFFSYSKNYLFPEFILLNPDYASLKKSIRENKIKIKDAIRKRDEDKKNEFIKTKIELNAKLAKVTTYLNSKKSLIFKFKRKYKFSTKINSDLKISKNIDISKKYKSLVLHGKKIISNYNLNLEYDYKNIELFLVKFRSIKKGE